MLKKRQNEVKRNIFLFDKIKNIAGQILTYKSKKFHWLNRKTRPRIDYEWIQKNILRKSEQKNKKKKTENQYQNTACEQKIP